ncbi:hypothetical protein CH372_17310 [Leptospira meyeri]|nr:hypothetical protein CH372_17310 [Leptospira meyeri]PKA23961.1 hypothetical protein CH381_23170 [Leptospira sp. mixed culture ATI2-C-A1]
MQILRITTTYRYASGLALARPSANPLLALLLLTQASCQSLTSRSGTQGQGTSVSLVRYTQCDKF